MTSDWVLIDLEVKEPDTCESRQTWTLHSDKKKTVSVGFAACPLSALRSSYLHPLQLPGHCDPRYLFNSFLTIDKTKIGTQPYRLFNPSNDDESPLPDYDHCSSSGNRLLRTFRAKFLHVRQLIAVKLEQNGRR